MVTINEKECTVVYAVYVYIVYIDLKKRRTKIRKPGTWNPQLCIGLSSPMVWGLAPWSHGFKGPSRRAFEAASVRDGQGREGGHEVSKGQFLSLGTLLIVGWCSKLFTLYLNSLRLMVHVFLICGFKTMAPRHQVIDRLIYDYSCPDVTAKLRLYDHREPPNTGCLVYFRSSKGPTGRSRDPPILIHTHIITNSAS